MRLCRQKGKRVVSPDNGGAAGRERLLFGRLREICIGRIGVRALSNGGFCALKKMVYVWKSKGAGFHLRNVVPPFLNLAVRHRVSR